MKTPIRTTVVGGYPVPDWLAPLPSQQVAFRGYDELNHFREQLNPKIGLGIAVIDIKVNTVETPEEVARRIENASKIMSPGRITWVHPDCDFWMNKRSIADRKMEALVKGRDLFLGMTTR